MVFAFLMDSRGGAVATSALKMRVVRVPKVANASIRAPMAAFTGCSAVYTSCSAFLQSV